MKIIKNRINAIVALDADRARVVIGFGPGRRAGRSATSINKGRRHQRQSAC